MNNKVIYGILISALLITCINFFIAPLFFKTEPDSKGTGIALLLTLIAIIGINSNKK